MRMTWALWAVAAVLLAGCFPKPAAEDALGPGGTRGRYVGIGLFSPDRTWAQLAGLEQPKDSKAARLEDDEQVIVVMDSTTGEIRQCGNLSGVCISMAPWSAPVAAGRAAPVQLQKHASEIDTNAATAAAPASETPQTAKAP